MPSREQVFPITDFKGLGNPFIFTGNPQKVRTMTNVRSHFGRIKCRGGYTTLSTEMTDGIIGFADFKAHDNTVTLLAVDDIGKAWTFSTGTGTWTDRTGGTTPTAGSKHVDFITHADNIYWTYPGAATVRRWTGSGSSANITPTVAGRFLGSFAGRIMVGYVPADTNGPQVVRYDALNNAATLPAANTLNLRETPGAIRKILPLAKACFVYKTDGAVILRLVGSSTVTFSQERAPMAVGLLASGAISDIPGIGHIFLGTDGRLYVNDGSLTQPVLTDLNNTLLDDISLADAQHSKATVDFSNNIYTLLYPGSGDTTLTKRLEFNYQTGEFTIFDHTVGFQQALWSQYANNDLLNPNYRLVVSGSGADDDQPFKFGTDLTDNGTTIAYEWQSDWFNMQESKQKNFLKLELIFDNSSRGDIEVAVATDFSNTFKTVGRVSTNVTGSDPDAIVRVNLASTVGHYFNLRFRFYPRGSSDDIVWKGAMAYYSPVDSQVMPMRQDIRSSS